MNLCTCRHQLQPHRRMKGVCPVVVFFGHDVPRPLTPAEIPAAVERVDRAIARALWETDR